MDYTAEKLGHSSWRAGDHVSRQAKLSRHSQSASIPLRSIPADWLLKNLDKLRYLLYTVKNERLFFKPLHNIVFYHCCWIHRDFFTGPIKTFSFPCSLDDLGEGFSFWDESMIYEEKTELRSWGLLYDGKLLDTVTMHCAADDNDYSDNDIICISFTASAFKRQDTIDNISIGGITLRVQKQK